MSDRRTREQARRFGERMERARLRNFLTVTQLAEDIVASAKAAGVDLTLDRSAVSRWLSGENEPHMRYRPFIARALGADPHDLFEPVRPFVYEKAS